MQGIGDRLKRSLRGEQQAPRPVAVASPRPPARKRTPSPLARAGDDHARATFESPAASLAFERAREERLEASLQEASGSLLKSRFAEEAALSDLLVQAERTSGSAAERIRDIVRRRRSELQTQARLTSLDRHFSAGGGGGSSSRRANVASPVGSMASTRSPSPAAVARPRRLRSASLGRSHGLPGRSSDDHDLPRPSWDAVASAVATGRAEAAFARSQPPPHSGAAATPDSARSRSAVQRRRHSRRHRGSDHTGDAHGTNGRPPSAGSRGSAGGSARRARSAGRHARPPRGPDVSARLSHGPSSTGRSGQQGRHRNGLRRSSQSGVARRPSDRSRRQRRRHRTSRSRGSRSSTRHSAASSYSGSDSGSDSESDDSGSFSSSGSREGAGLAAETPLQPQRLSSARAPPPSASARALLAELEAEDRSERLRDTLRPTDGHSPWQDPAGRQPGGPASHPSADSSGSPAGSGAHALAQQAAGLAASAAGAAATGTAANGAAAARRGQERSWGRAEPTTGGPYSEALSAGTQGSSLLLGAAAAAAAAAARSQQPRPAAAAGAGAAVAPPSGGRGGWDGGGAGEAPAAAVARLKREAAEAVSEAVRAKTAMVEARRAEKAALLRAERSERALADARSTKEAALAEAENSRRLAGRASADAAEQRARAEEAEGRAARAEAEARTTSAEAEGARASGQRAAGQAAAAAAASSELFQVLDLALDGEGDAGESGGAGGGALPGRVASVVARMRSAEALAAALREEAEAAAEAAAEDSRLRAEAEEEAAALRVQLEAALDAAAAAERRASELAARVRLAEAESSGMWGARAEADALRRRVAEAEEAAAASEKRLSAERRLRCVAEELLDTAAARRAIAGSSPAESRPASDAGSVSGLPSHPAAAARRSGASPPPAGLDARSPSVQSSSYGSAALPPQRGGAHPAALGAAPVSARAATAPWRGGGDGGAGAGAAGSAVSRLRHASSSAALLSRRPPFAPGQHGPAGGGPKSSDTYRALDQLRAARLQRAGSMRPLLRTREPDDGEGVAGAGGAGRWQSLSAPRTGGLASSGDRADGAGRGGRNFFRPTSAGAAGSRARGASSMPSGAGFSLPSRLDRRVHSPEPSPASTASRADAAPLAEAGDAAAPPHSGGAADARSASLPPPPPPGTAGAPRARAGDPDRRKQRDGGVGGEAAAAAAAAAAGRAGRAEGVRDRWAGEETTGWGGDGGAGAAGARASGHGDAHGRGERGGAPRDRYGRGAGGPGEAGDEHAPSNEEDEEVAAGDGGGGEQEADEDEVDADEELEEEEEEVRSYHSHASLRQIDLAAGGRAGTWSGAGAPGTPLMRSQHGGDSPSTGIDRGAAAADELGGGGGPLEGRQYFRPGSMASVSTVQGAPVAHLGAALE